MAARVFHRLPAAGPVQIIVPLQFPDQRSPRVRMAGLLLVESIQHNKPDVFPCDYLAFVRLGIGTESCEGFRMPRGIAGENACDPLVLKALSLVKKPGLLP